MIGVVEFTPELGFQLFGGGGGAAGWFGGVLGGDAGGGGAAGWFGGVLGGDAGAEAPLPPLAGGVLGSGIVTTPEPSEPPLEDPEPACVPAPPPEEADDPPRAGAADPTPRDELPEAAEPPDVPPDAPDPTLAPCEVEPPVDGEPPVRTDPALPPSDRCDVDEPWPVGGGSTTTRPTRVAGSRPSPPPWLPRGTTEAGTEIGDRPAPPVAAKPGRGAPLESSPIAEPFSNCGQPESTEAGSRPAALSESKPASNGAEIASLAAEPSLGNAARSVP